VSMLEVPKCTGSMSNTPAVSLVADPIRVVRRDHTNGRCPGAAHSYPPAKRVSLADVLRTMKLSGWYWEELPGENAIQLLKDKSIGTFLLRDSYDDCHLFTLSVKSYNNVVVSVRVIFSRGYFKLDSAFQDTPLFPSVVDLVEHYLADEQRSFHVEVPDMGDFAVVLRRPLYKNVLSLQHICRRTIVKHLQISDNIDGLPLPPHLIDYLQDYRVK